MEDLQASIAALTGKLDAVDGALARIEAGTYGRCSACQAPIEAHRLEADPTTTNCAAHPTLEES